MKRTFLLKRNALLSSASVSWGACALTFALVLFLVRLLAPNFFWHVFTPVFHSADALSARSHSFLQSFSDAAVLASRNEQLTNENAALASENQALSQKVANISALAGSPTSAHNSPTGILAGVVARPPESPYDTLVLAAGTNAGVTVGMEVFCNGGVPLGVISSVLADFSRATLFSMPGANTAGWVGRENLPVTISGAGAGAMNAITARSANVTTGDVVFVQGPGMLPIGVVTRIDSDLSSPSVTLRIQPALNLFSLSWVLIRDTGAELISATSSLL
ncbi:MAG: rod shape-determining protein MreC [Candidatus Kaiserbacteria bacterium]|nr:rod shape-determining protein MreC [Candidatus Kaiserbacteria bacterium]